MNRYIIAKGILKEKSKKELMRIIDNFQKEMEKQEKYRWHDLRKDPTDLPQKNGTYLVTEEVNAVFRLTFIGIYNYDAFENKWYKIGSQHISGGEVINIAWREIEPFEEVE